MSNTLSGKKIMWIEDDNFLSDIIARKLATQDCTLVYSRDGAGALELAEKEMPDIILLDIFLPNVNGFDLLQSFKSNPKIKDIPVIILSNLDQTTDLAKGKSLGIARYIVKAMASLDEIIAQIKEVLNDITKP